MRFIAPARQDVAAATFAHPVFAPFAHRADLLRARHWPTIDTLNRELGDRSHARSGMPIRFVAQTAGLVNDGLHYEARIFEQGIIATRPDNWHDLFNALMWMDHFPIKCAVNAAYTQELAVPKTEARTRRQCALTHFDEAGALVIVRDLALLEPWDAHDWHGLFWRGRTRWDSSAEVILFGHSLLEHLLIPGAMPVAKCIVVHAMAANRGYAVSRSIVEGQLLRDPQDLRPLPLAGLRGWHADNANEFFYREAACFRPRRPGRVYPEVACGSPPVPAGSQEASRPTDDAARG